MKKTIKIFFTQILVAFLFATLVISCGNKAKDIDVSKIKTECEFVDAMNIVLDEIIALGYSVDSKEGASEEQKKEYESLKEIAKEIEGKPKELDLDKKKMQDCPNFETVDKKGEKFRRAIEEFE